MEKEKMIDAVMAYSPIERQIDMYGCEIGVSRQWYNETTDILMDINKGVYRKVPEGAVVLTKEELAKHDEDIRKEAAREMRDYLNGILRYDMTQERVNCYWKVLKWVLEHFKIEEEETNSSDNENGAEVE